MEQNMESNQAQQHGTEGTQQQNSQGQQQQKTFTQDEVNQIVQTRLARYKSESDTKGFAERERALNQRELQLEARERLADAGLPKGLLDVVNCNSKEDMEKSINALSAYFNNNQSAGGKTTQKESENIYKKQLEQMQNEKFLAEKGVRANDLDYVVFKVSQRVDAKTDFKTAAEVFLKENPRFSGPTYRVSTGTQTRGNDSGKGSDADIRKAMGLKGR